MRSPLFCAVVLWCAGINAAHAQTKFDPQARADAVAPFIDEQTIGVVHADLTRVDFDRLLKQAAELAPGAEDVTAWLGRFRPLVEQLLKSGAKHLYVVVSLADLPQPPFVVIPLAAEQDAEAFKATLANLPFETVERVGNSLVAGGKRALERVKTQPASARPEAARAFAAAGDTAAQILLLPSADVRRAIEELLPALPAEAGGGASKVITRGAMWTAAAIDFSPRAALKLVIQSQDPQAAAALRDKWVAALHLAGRDARVEEIIPQFKQFAEHLEPAVKGDRLQLSVDAQGAAGKKLGELLKSSLSELQKMMRGQESRRRLKQIGLAMHNYHDLYKSLPAAANYSAEGKPLLSWRVHILPFLDQEALYKEFHLDEPWDSEHNRKLIERMPQVFRSANWSPEQPSKTCFVVVTSEGSPTDGRKQGSQAGEAEAEKATEAATAFQGREGVKFQDIMDGTSMTIMVVEADAEHAVLWTRPEDLPFDREQPTKGFGVNVHGSATVLFCDGSVRLLKRSLDPETWRRLLLCNDGKVVSGLGE